MVIFLGTTMRAAEYWAQQWGFKRSEVILATFDTPDRLRGYHPGIPVYLCGPTEWDYERVKHATEMLEYLQTVGHTIYDAQEMGNEYRMPLPSIET